MALKYWFEFTDVKEILHRCEIYNDDFVGDSTQIYGSLTLSKANTEDTLEAIRGGGLKIDLEANTDLTFEDLYSENERVFSVKYIRDSVELFYGWLSPEGLYQSYVNDKWIISLDCTDGLGFLKNLSYVNNNGLPFSGKQSMLEVIVNCLKRTNLTQNIYTEIGINYELMTVSNNVLAETYINANRFLKDDQQQTIMQCDEVLRSILEPFAACITQYKGGWYIYKPNELFDNSELNMFAYDSDGAALNPTKVTIDFSQVLGSQINDFYPHHVNENQQLTIDSAIGAYRINYKYGLVKSFFENVYLESELIIPNLNPTVDEWTIDDYTYLDFPTDERGLLLDSLAFSTPFATPNLVMTSDSFNFATDNVIQFRLTSLRTGQSVQKATTRDSYKVILTDTVTTYYMDNDGNWSTTDTFIELLSSINTKTNIINSNKIPIDGDVYIEIYNPVRITNQGDVPTVFVSECGFLPIDEELKDVKGENHTFEIKDNPSTKIEDVKEVFNGDNPSDVYLGTIYQNDESTPTELWYRDVSNLRFIPLLQIMGEERMKMYAKPLRVFSGDVFGYVDYLSLITIDGINNIKFMPIEYKYNALNNITTIKLKEVLNNPLPDDDYGDIDYSLTFDYGTVVEPTIKG